MDLYCPRCGEPWENDSLHDEAAARYGKSSVERYRIVASEFRRIGCEAMREAFGASCSTPNEDVDSSFGLTRQQAASALYELLGDDMDGAATMLDDMF